MTEPVSLWLRRSSSRKAPSWLTTPCEASEFCLRQNPHALGPYQAATGDSSRQTAEPLPLSIFPSRSPTSIRMESIVRDLLAKPHEHLRPEPLYLVQLSCPVTTGPVGPPFSPNGSQAGFSLDRFMTRYDPRGFSLDKGQVDDEPIPNQCTASQCRGFCFCFLNLTLTVDRDLRSAAPIFVSKGKLPGFRLFHVNLRPVSRTVITSGFTFWGFCRRDKGQIENEAVGIQSLLAAAGTILRILGRGAHTADYGAENDVVVVSDDSCIGRRDTIESVTDQSALQFHSTSGRDEILQQETIAAGDRGPAAAMPKGENLLITLMWIVGKTNLSIYLNWALMYRVLECLPGYIHNSRDTFFNEKPQTKNSLNRGARIVIMTKCGLQSALKDELFQASTKPPRRHHQIDLPVDLQRRPSVPIVQTDCKRGSSSKPRITGKSRTLIKRWRSLDAPKEDRSAAHKGYNRGRDTTLTAASARDTDVQFRPLRPKTNTCDEESKL
ncbi:hypothetical protein C8J56DRAFT_1053995 [Mycena floridula]|nr:hypothetical protein C8J56DRAFT_1053995 [Mycena floridula]